jgi:hypothetical protein
MRRTTKTVLWHLFMAGAGIGGFAAWRWQLRWGATAAERRRVLPGDEVVPMPGLQATRAIGIAAPPGAVWPWVAQLGAGRAGFYSYDWLERAAGLDIENADAIVEEWQGVSQGDSVKLAEDISLAVATAVPERALVLAGEGSPPPGMGGDFEFSWAFVLEPEGPTGTRLVVRERYAWTAPRDGLIIRAAAWASFFMSRAMLRGIRDRAERAWRERVTSDLDDAVPGPPEAAGPGTGEEAGSGAAASGTEAPAT